MRTMDADATWHAKRWVAAAVVSALVVLRVLARSFHAGRHQHAHPPAVEMQPAAGGRWYTTWPSPRTSRCEASLTAFGLLRQGADGLEQAGKALVAKASPGAGPPPVLVIAGDDMDVGLGNILNLLAEAAVLAHSVGAACVFTFGSNYAGDIAFGRMPTFPCVIAPFSVVQSLRAQAVFPVESFQDWRLGNHSTIAAAAARAGVTPWESAMPLAIDLLHGGEDCARNDVSQEWAPPGMAPRQFWPRLRSKYREMVLHTNDPRVRTGPRPEALGRTAGSGTICGHMRLLSREIYRTKGPAKCGPRSDCGVVLFAMNELHRVRPFASYFFAAPANCSHCLPRDAKDLLRDARRLTVGGGNSDARIASAAGGVSAAHTGAVGAMQDMRTLAQCELIVVDDPPHNTFIQTAAAAGGLRPCGQPLRWIADLKPSYLHEYSAQAKRLRGDSWHNPGRHYPRLLCPIGSEEDAPKQSRLAPRCPGREAAVSVALDLTRPWLPVRAARR